MQYKQLPPNPNLEHLKSQAKQLLKARKESFLDAFQRIRTFFPKLSDATDTEIQQTTFGLQDAQFVIAREYGFASWTRLKEAVLHQEQVAERPPTKDLLFQILRAPDPTQTDIQRVEELLITDPSLVSARDEEGRTPLEALASRGLINFGKARWFRPIRQLYDLFREHGAATNLVAAVLMDDREYVETAIRNNPEVLKQRFDRSRTWSGISLLGIAAGCDRIEIATLLIEADPSLVTAGQAEGNAPMDLLVKPWHHSAFEAEPRMPFYNLLIENGAVPDLGAAIIMGDLERVRRYVGSNPQLIEQEFVCGNRIIFRPVEYEMSPLLVAIGTWYGIREAVEALDECLEIVEALLDAGADVHRRYRVDIDGEILELTPLTYTQKLASLFSDKPFGRIIEVLSAGDAT